MLFSARYVQSGYKDVFDSVEQNRSSRVEFRDASLPGYELVSRGIELSRVFEIGLSRDSSVGIATSYGLDDQGVGVRVPVKSSPNRPDRL
jgi:hypothetical protein